MDEFGTLQKLNDHATLDPAVQGRACGWASKTSARSRRFTARSTRNDLQWNGHHIRGRLKRAEFLSKRSRRGIVETEESVAMGGESGGKDGITISRRYKTERLVLPSEIARLKDLEMFVQIPNYDMVTAKQTWRPYPVVAEALSMRQDMLLSSIGRRKAGSSEDKVAEFLEKVRTGA